MPSAIKLTCLSALLLLFASACQPDLNSLSAGYAASLAGSGPAGGGDSGGTGNSGSGGELTGSGGATPPPPSCANLARDPGESDVDCGGTSMCQRCGTSLRCTANRDCASSFCKSSHCAEPTCGDGVQNQDETAPDCGGSCKGCDDNVACLVNADCVGEFCKNALCTDHCTSGAREADETDKDCGGTQCAPCADNHRCAQASDCQSAVCFNNKCQPATCGDKVQNQDESDTDCGGVCSVSKPCAVSAHCNAVSDCASYICTKSKCVADIDVAAGDIIDDFEDVDLLLPASPALGGRVGTWYAYGDGSGTVTENVVSVQRAASRHSLHTTGMGFTSWGSSVGVDLNNSGAGLETKRGYDASAYSGVTFWARADAAVPVTVVLPDTDTDAAGGTGACALKSGGVCDHHYFKDVQVDTTWRRFTVPFASLTLEPGGDPAPTAFKPSGIVSVQFRMQSGLTYELWIDDVAFVK